MAIRRRQIQQDVAHGGLNNQDFVANGIPMYKDKGSINHADAFETDPHLTFVKGTVDTLNVCGTTNISDDLNVGCNVCICGTTDIDGATCIDDTLNVSCATCLCDTLNVDGATTLNCTLDVCGATCIDNTLNVTCATCINDTLTVDCDACFKEDVTIDCNTCICGTLDVDGVSHLNADVTISGDLYVCGTRHEEHTADLYVGSDLVTLRDGNHTALETGAKSGIIIDNYDGVDSLGIVTDNTGTLRIGEYNTVKVYTEDDISFYSDRELTTPITLPAGAVLHSLGQDGSLKIYYYVTKDETEPVATRSATMCDGQLTCWNAAGCDIHTIGAQPVGEGAILQCDIANNCHFYLENNGAGRILEVDPTTDKLRWSCAASCNGQIPVFDGDKTVWTPEPTANGQFLKWNTATCSFDLISPGNNGEVLTTSEDPTTHVKSLAWACLPSNYVFDTMAEYNAVAADIPANSRVTILCEENYTMSVDVQ